MKYVYVVIEHYRSRPSEWIVGVYDNREAADAAIQQATDGRRRYVMKWPISRRNQ